MFSLEFCVLARTTALAKHILPRPLVFKLEYSGIL